MQVRRKSGAFWQLVWLVTISLCGGTGCSTVFSPTSEPLPVANQLGRKVAVTVDSSPGGALISVNGMVKGTAPVSIDVELDDLGDVAVELEVKADFSDSFGGQKSTAVTTYRLARGDRAPSSMTLDTDSASVR